MSTIKERMEAIYAARQKMFEETQDEWDYGIQKIVDEEIDILCEDMNETVRYLNEECTAEGFVWISEVMEDVAERTQSLELVESLYKLAEKYPEVTKEYNIMSFVEGSKGVLKQLW